MTERPLVVAHRGASAQFAEHTLLAYSKAIEAGADALECDVRLTRDSQLVCVHDRTVDRTSNGQGVVANFTLDQLKAMDFASWKGNPEQYPEGVLSLPELLELVRAAPRPVRLLIETKHPSRFSGLVEKELVGLLGEYGWLDGERVTVMSFAELALRRVRLLAPQLPRVLLFDRLGRRVRDGRLPGAITIAGPSLRALRAGHQLVEQVHRHDGQVFVWTVDALEDVRFARQQGVDAIITNDPAATIEEIDAEEAIEALAEHEATKQQRPESREPVASRPENAAEPPDSESTASESAESESASPEPAGPEPDPAGEPADRLDR